MLLNLKKAVASALGLAMFAAAMVLLSAMHPAHAADKGGQSGSILPIKDLTEAAKASWSGIGIGAYGSWINADTDTVPSLGLTGQSAGGTLTASLQMGSVVAEAFGDYGWVFGDLKDLGVDTEMAVGGRLGFLVNQQTFVYGLGAKSWLDTSAGMINGWQYGGGVQVRFPSTPTYLSLEYRHGEYDTAGIIGVDATTDTVRLGLTYKFNTK